ncbi:uncharacterized protein C8Q71DRAFT_700572 [Rhodofomes roseus]|uniref:Nucleoside diphosphate kinase n=1 Tax=Rhodofomes roseus TaxID=34475 RepID=A0ABQ8KS38_9APHY|nr:uncharacterized protein C8Q71DRAFT_700572 [Rhodofomes roseus]KAH9841628.1 hypothetical protein C8Q71DRAFT_700572 [Rhodofomes roseus]
MGSPAPPHNHELPLETETESDNAGYYAEQEAAPAAEQELLYEPEAPSTPIPPVAPLTLSPAAATRTVAIIKPHALPHRFDIEHRISEAGFEIVKERQMEFDVETDPETMYDLFGDDYECFAEGPVWVYVLERRRAVEVWATLMGHPDPAVAREETPNALRALYGTSVLQNAVMGSPDSPTAEFQISAIFASSPPFPTTDLPDVGSAGLTSGSVRSMSSSVLSALRRTGSSGDSGKSPFKARKLPATHAAPDIVPRMSRAASLRAGIPVEKTSGPRGPISKERLAQTFENVPGHKRSSTITVASTAPPTVAPRMTRAAALRLGLPPPEKETRRQSLQLTSSGKVKGPEEPKATFDGVPGHKRRETITVASVKAPTVMPRTNKSASLRQQKDAAPPTSYMFRAPSGQTPSRSSSRTSFNGTGSARPTISRPPSAASVQLTPSRPMTSRVTSASSVKTTTTTTSQRPSSRPATSAGIKRAPSVSATSTSNGGGAAKDKEAAKPRPRPSSVQAPTIAPRTNKSALLRAQKMAAAAVTAVTPGGKKGVAATPRAVRV